MTVSLLWPFLFAVVCTISCSSSEEILASEEEEGHQSGNTATDSDTSTVINDSDDTLDDYCVQQDPSITVPAFQSDNRHICTGQLAEDTFRFALCTCKDAISMGPFQTYSFDSMFGPSENTDPFGGAVGVNRDMFIPEVLEIGGSAILAGSDGVVLPSVAAVNGDFKVKGNVEFSGELNVSRDLHVGDDLINFGVVDIGRDLYLGGNMALPDQIVPTGRMVTGPVQVAPPCSCESDQLIDINTIVSDAVNDNDNSKIQLNEDGLRTVIGDTDIEIGCGRFYLSQVVGLGKLTLRVSGHTALFVDGDFIIAGALTLELEELGELDVFVSGDLQLTGSIDFSNVTRPSAVRFYVAGSNDVEITGYTRFVGNLYAPNAKVVLTGATSVIGAIFAGDFLSMGDTSIIHYDRDIIRAGDDCDDPCEGEDCDDSSDSCKSADEGCSTDSDCCEPLICEAETCQPLLSTI